MLVGRLRILLDGLPDDMMVITSGSDHSYNHISNADPTDVVLDKRTITEYYRNMELRDDETIVKALVIE